MINKVLVREDNKQYWKEGDVHTKDGVLKAEDIKKAKSKLLSHSGKEFLVYDANYTDQIKKISRGPQTLVMKDLGQILINSGVDKNSIVVDAGSGCGLIAATLAKYAKKVTSYDINTDNLKLAKKNLAFLEIDNVELKEGNVYDKIDETNVDILTLDLPEPWRVNLDCVKNGGTIIVYLPTIVQVIEFCNTSKDHIEKVIETLEREWYVEGRKVRPKSQMLGHTAFLIIVRKL